MEFLGTIKSGVLKFDDVLGKFDDNYLGGRFVLNPGESLSIGDHILAVGSVTYQIRISQVIGGDPSKARAFEFVCCPKK